MKCPNCQSKMKRELMEDRVPVYRCVSCAGTWVSSSEFANWIEGQASVPVKEEISKESVNIPVLGARKPLLCPDCGRIVRRFKIWPNLEFYLDRCGGCNGIWFDQHEWEVFSEHWSVKNLNIFFTDEWQQKLKKEEMASRFSAMYLERFGEDDYNKIQDIRKWIYANSNKDQLVAYLLDSNPYES
ncbi:MAG: zf-TFIIB domain-containing protein [bacterium]|nr:zf-TFIIB domain-containing protein [bacterium]